MVTTRTINNRGFFRSIILAGLLLVAQYSALVHSTWHLRDFLPGQAQQAYASSQHDHQDGDRPSGSKLCDLHAVLGALLVVGCGALPPAAQPAEPTLSTSRAFSWLVARNSETPPTRAPPVFS